MPHRHFVFALPKALRSAFRHRRSLLAKLALCAWNAVAPYIRADTGGEALPGAIVSIQTAGSFLNWHPHLHVLATAGAFTVNGNFLRAPHVDVAACRELFQAHVLRLLRKEQMISPELVDRMRTWRHSGFHAFAGDLIPESDDAARFGIYMARGPAASSRLRIDAAQEPKLRYLAKGAALDHGDGAEPVFHQDFDYLDWTARLTSHIPEKGAQVVHYYGAYSNAHRGKALRREAFTLPDSEGQPPMPEPNSEWIRERRRSWARLIRRVYEADPLLCQCGQRMRVVGFITQVPTIRKILDHFGRRLAPLKLPSRAPPLLDDFCPDPFPDYGPQ